MLFWLQPRRLYYHEPVYRGLFRSILFRSYRDEERRMGSLLREDFGCPNRANTVDMRRGNYHNLDLDGFVTPGTQVFQNDIIIGKTVRIDQNIDSQAKYHDHSTYLRPNERGRVDRVMLTTNEDDLALVKVRVRSVRSPEIGDKFSSRHGQKGVIGMTYTQEDLPWTVEGITPDIIINPHAIPSRMTIGQLMESIMGKVAAQMGVEADATPFIDVTVDSIAKALHKCGYQKKWAGNHVQWPHREVPTCQSFYWPNIVTYYLKLKHLVEDKIYSRARGRVEKLTRQPTHGRSRGGGLRFGEMERDCIISHGCALNLKERLFEVSDPYSINICETCGFIAQTKSSCELCKTRSGGISQVHVPYAWKLLCQELKSMGIAPKMVLN